MTAADLGGQWKVYSGKVAGTSASVCDPNHMDAAAAAFSDGPILQNGEKAQFTNTSTYEFPDSAAAEAFAQFRLSDQRIECVRKYVESEATKGSKRTVRAYDQVRTKGVGDFRGRFAFNLNEQATGQPAYDVAVEYYDIYRRGSVVVVDFTQQAYSDQLSSAAAVELYKEAGGGMQKVLKRLPA